MRIAMIIALVLLASCSQGEEELETQPMGQPYTVQDSDIVSMHGEKKNVKRLDEFVQNVKWGVRDEVRIVSYTIEGAAILEDLDYDKHLEFTRDTTRDGYGSQTVETITCDSIHIEEERDGKSYQLDCGTDVEVFFVPKDPQ